MRECPTKKTKKRASILERAILRTTPFFQAKFDYRPGFASLSVIIMLLSSDCLQKWLYSYSIHVTDNNISECISIFFSQRFNRNYVIFPASMILIVSNCTIMLSIFIVFGICAHFRQFWRIFSEFEWFHILLSS